MIHIKLLTFLIKLALFYIHIEQLNTFDSQTIYTTEAFNTPYSLKRFAEYFNQKDYNKIEVMASLSGHPDLPKWMKWFHRPASEIGYFYGTPAVDNDGDIDIEIILLDKFTFNVTRDRFKYTIINREQICKNQAQIQLFNLDLEDFVQKNVSDLVLDIFRKKLWQSDQVYITKMARPIDVGGRFPLDPREKEGVTVFIGSMTNFTEELLRLEGEAAQIRSRNPCPKRFKASSAEYLFREKKLIVDWCRFKLLPSAP